jgi:hypothetical protein
MRIEVDLPSEVADRLRRRAADWGMDPVAFVTAIVGISADGLPALERGALAADGDPEATPEQTWRAWETFRDNMNENRFPGSMVYPLDDLSSYTPPPGVEGRRRLPGSPVATAEANPVRTAVGVS